MTKPHTLQQDDMSRASQSQQDRIADLSLPEALDFVVLVVLCDGFKPPDPAQNHAGKQAERKDEDGNGR